MGTSRCRRSLRSTRSAARSSRPDARHACGPCGQVERAVREVLRRHGARLSLFWGRLAQACLEKCELLFLELKFNTDF